MAITAKESWHGACHLVSFSAATVTATLLLSLHSGAAEWQITPRLDLKETYTDNVALMPRGLEKSDFVTEINPGISLMGSGPRLKVNANYQMQNLFYAEEDSRNTTWHQLNANANAELVDNLFFLDGKAGISQQNISLFGPQTANNLNATGNRTEVRTYSISPYLRHSFHKLASSELRYSHDSVDTSTSGLWNSQTDRIQFRLDSGPAFRTFGWGLNFSDEKIAYKNTENILAQDIDSKILSGNLRYLITPRFSLKATAGYEENNYIPIGEKPEGSFWSTGFSWAPTARTSIDASAGRRFFGDTYSLAATHRTRASFWNLSYSEDITSTQSEFLIPTTIDTATFLNQLWAASIPDTAIRQQFVDTFIRNTGLPPALSEPLNYFTNRLFLQKSLQASVAFTGAKNTVVLSMFNVSREAQTSEAMDSALFGSSNLALSERTKQLGGSALWTWRIGPLTTANISAAYTRNNFTVVGRTDDDKTIRLGLTRQLQPKLNGSVELRRLQRDSNQSGNDYRENAVMASLSMRF